MSTSARPVQPDHPPASVCVVLHDVAPPAWEACRRLCAAVHEVASVPLTWLLVPHYHGAPFDPVFEHAVTERLALGDELALHGYTHLDDAEVSTPLEWLLRRCYTRGEGEFSRLPFLSAHERLRDGRQWFAANGWPLHGFVAPAWLLGTDARLALALEPFQYTCTLRYVHALPEGRALRSQSLVYSCRSAWRRLASRGWNRALAAVQRRQLLLRLELHPADAEHRAVRLSWQRILAQALADGRQPSTLADFVAAWRASAAFSRTIEFPARW